MTPFSNLSDSDTLLLVLAALYVVECTTWLPSESVCVSALWRNYRRIAPFPFMANSRGGFLILDWAPFAMPLICEEWPCAVSPNGFGSPPTSSSEISGESAAESSEFLPIDQLHTIVREGRQLRFNDHSTVRFPSEASARLWESRLRPLIKLEPQERPAWIEKLRVESLDIAAARQRLQTARQNALACRVASTWLFVYSFLVGLLVLHFAEGIPQPLIIFLSGLILFWLLAVYCFSRAHRAIYADASGRRKQLMSILLAPTAAMRAPARLTVGLMADFQSAVVVVAVCAPSNARD